MPKGDKRPPTALQRARNMTRRGNDIMESHETQRRNMPKLLKPEEAIRGPKSGAVRDWLQKT